MKNNHNSHLYSLISSTTSGSHSLYFSKSANSWVRSCLRAFSSFSREFLSVWKYKEQFCFFKLSVYLVLSHLVLNRNIQGESAYKNILTVSWRPSLAFSTAFCRDTLRCFAWEFLKINKFHLRFILHQIATMEKWFPEFCQRVKSVFMTWLLKLKL